MLPLQASLYCISANWLAEKVGQMEQDIGKYTEEQIAESVLDLSGPLYPPA